MMKYLQCTLLTVLFCAVAWAPNGYAQTVTSQVSLGTDDAEETLSSGAMNTNSPSLEMGEDNFAGSSDFQRVGLRFKNMTIPVGATITSATITFTSNSNASDATSLTLSAEAADNPTAFSGSNSDLSSRTATSASVAWSSVTAWTRGTAYASPDVSTIVQELVDRAGWASGNAMVFFVEGTGHRDAQAYEADPTAAPELQVTYTVASGTLVSSRVSLGSDDAEETLASGAMNTTSAGLEMGEDNFAGSGDFQRVGLRFKNMTIPAGATITSARIIFTSNSNASDATSLTFSAEAADNPTAFSVSNSDLSSRTATAAIVAWSGVTAWTSNATYASPDVSPIVQELVDRAGWASGNEMVFFVEGTGHREARAFDLDPGAAPLLEVTYTAPAAPSLQVLLRPKDAPVTVEPSGGRVRYEVSVTNNGTTALSTELWVEVTGPSTYRMRGPRTLTLNPGQTWTRRVRLRVPGRAPAGTYTVTASAGTYPAADDSDHFTFDKHRPALKNSLAAPHTSDADDWAMHFDTIPEASTPALETPTAFTLEQNYPNPFNPTTAIAFTLDEAGPATLTVYNMLGQAVANLATGYHTAGRHTVTFEATHLSAGTYVYVLQTPHAQQTRRMVLLK